MFWLKKYLLVRIFVNSFGPLRYANPLFLSTSVLTQGSIENQGHLFNSEKIFVDELILVRRTKKIVYILFYKLMTIIVKIQAHLCIKNSL